MLFVPRVQVEAVTYQDMIDCGSLKAVKESGKLRSEGKDYVVQEGDVLNFLHRN